MKDKTLHTFRRTPDDTYTENLLERLERIPETAATQPTQPAHPRRLRLDWVLASLLLMFLVMAVSPVVRARIEDVVKQIGGLNLLITEEYPGGLETARVVEPDIISLEEARTRVEFEFYLPDFLPDGLTLQEDQIIASNIEDNLWLTWEDEAQPGRQLHLQIQTTIPNTRFVVGPDSAAEVMVNEKPAILIRGGWDQGTESWQDDGLRILRWELNGVTYSLQTGNEEWGGLTQEELIQVAESIQPTSSGIR